MSRLEDPTAQEMGQGAGEATGDLVAGQHDHSMAGSLSTQWRDDGSVGSSAASRAREKAWRREVCGQSGSIILGSDDERPREIREAGLMFRTCTMIKCPVGQFDQPWVELWIRMWVGMGPPLKQYVWGGGSRAIKRIIEAMKN